MPLQLRYVLTSLEGSTASLGSLQIHVEIGHGRDGEREGEGESEHLFAGSREGCTKMCVVDLGGLRERKKRRGSSDLNVKS